MCAKYLLIILFSFILFLSHVGCTKRQITCTIYDEQSNTETTSLLYVKAVGTEDTLHYVWSTYKLPSVMIARSSPDVNLEIDIQKIASLKTGAIKFTAEPFKVTGLIISELWQKFYKKDTDKPDDVASEIPMGLEFFEWSEIDNKSVSCSDHAATLTLKTKSSEEIFSNNGTMKLQFRTTVDEEYDNISPHLIYNGNSTRIRVVLDNLYSNSSKIRYGLEMAVFNSLSNKNVSNCQDCQAVTSYSISDEFSPGIFSDVDIKPPSECDEKDSFLTWRPVAYTGAEPTVANSTDARMYSKCDPYSITSVRSIIELYFHQHINHFENAFNITFGTQGDGFYHKNEFSSWSLMIGTGSSVHTELSASVIIFSSIGIGALLLFLLAGGIFLIVRRCRNRDDDLLLSEHSVN